MYSTIAVVDRMAELTAQPSADTVGLIIINMWDGRFLPSLTHSTSCHILIRYLVIGVSCLIAGLVHSLLSSVGSSDRLICGFSP